MKRRSFLKLMGWAAAAAPAGSAVASWPADDTAKKPVDPAPTLEPGPADGSGRYRVVRDYDILTDRAIGQVDCATRSHHWAISFEIVGNPEIDQATIEAAVFELERKMFDAHARPIDLGKLQMPDGIPPANVRFFDSLADVEL